MDHSTGIWLGMSLGTFTGNIIFKYIRKESWSECITKTLIASAIMYPCFKFFIRG